MKKLHLPLKAIGIVVLVVMMGLGSKGVTITIQSNTNWSAITSGSGAGGQPSNADAIIVRSSRTLTVNVTNAVCGSLQLGRINSNNSGNAGTLTFTGTNPALTVTSAGGLSGIVTLGGYGNTGSDGTITFINTATLTAVGVILGSSNTTPAQGIITMTNGSTLNTGSLSVGTGAGSWTPGTGTVVLTANNTLPATIFTSFNNLTVNSGTTTTSGRSFSVAGTMTVNGTFTPGAAHVISGGTLTGTGTVQVSRTTATADFLSQYPITTKTLTNLTVEYTVPAGGQVVSSTTYNNLTLSNTSGINTTGGAVTVDGTLTTTAGGTFNMATNTLSVATVSHSAILRTQNTSATPISSGKTWGGTVQYDASAAQSVASGTYANLTMSGTGGGVAAGDITVNGVLNLSAANPNSTNGTLEMTSVYGDYSNIITPTELLTTTKTQAHDILDSYILYMGPAATTIGTGDVTGKVKRTTIADNTEYTFGNPNTSITFTKGTGTLPTAVLFVITKGPDRGIHANKTNTVERLYQVIRTGGDDLATFALKLHYLDSELNGNSESNTVLWDHHIPYNSTNTPHEHGKVSQSSGDNWIILSGHGTNYLSSQEVIGGFTKYWMISTRIIQGNKWLGSVQNFYTDWTQPSNWTMGRVPLASDTVIIPNTTYAPTLPATATAKSITIEAGGTLNGGSGILTIKGGIQNNGGPGSWNNYGTFNPGTSTVVFDFPRTTLNETSTIAGTANFNNITIGNSTFLTLQTGSYLSISGSFTNSGTLDCATYDNTVEYKKAGTQTVLAPNGANPGYYNLILSGTSAKTLPTLAVGNDFTLSGSATVTQAPGNTLTIGGNFLHNSTGNFTFGGTVNIKGITAQTIGGSSSLIKFTTLNINNASGISLTKNITATNLLISNEISGSILSDNGFQITGNALSGVINMSENSTLVLGSSTSATTFPEFFEKYLHASSLVIYASGQDQEVSTIPSYGNLNIAENSIKTTVPSFGTLVIKGNWLNESNINLSFNSTSVTLDGNYSGSGTLTQGGAITVGGDWTNNGAFTPSSATVTFTGSNRQIAGTGNLTFNTLSVGGVYTNNRSGILTASTSLLGVGTLILGTNSQLNLGGTISSLLGLNTTSNGPNTVVYNKSGAQSIKSTNYNNLKLEGSGVKTFQAGTTSIMNDLTIDGTASAQGQVNFTIGGNIIIGSTASFYVSPTSTATISGEIVNDGGTAGLVIQSAIDGTGSLVSTTPNINATVERYIANDQLWHFLSSPVSSQPIWPEFAPEPTDNSWGAYDPGLPYNWDFYYYNPNALVASQLYWVNLRKDETGAYNNGTDMASGSNAGYGTATPPSFIAGRGYLTAYFTDWNPTTGSPETHSFSGILNSDSVNVPIYYNSGNTYNLIGNPYPCSIDWMEDIGWTRTCLGPGPDANDFWIYNDANHNYGAFSNSAKSGTNGVSQYIAPGQAFFVRAASAGTLTMKNAAKKHNTQLWLKNTDADNTLIRLDLTCSANTYKDEMIVKFDPSFTGGGTQKFNSFYAEAPELYSVKDGNNYSIDRYNTLTDDMKVDIAAKTGVAATYTITATNIADFTLRDKVYLLDKKTGVKTNLKQTPSYSFAGTPDDDRNRFQLIFGTSIGVDEETNSDITIYASENIIYVRNDKANEPYTVMVSNMLGQIITRTKLAGNTLNQIELNRVPGIYVVTVYSEGSLFSKKVVVK